MKPPYAIGSVPSLSGHAVAYRWRSLPRVCRHRASKPQGSSERVLPWQITMDQLIFASLSHTHYWYEVGMYPVIYVVANPIRGLLDRKRLEEYLQSSSESKKQNRNDKKKGAITKYTRQKKIEKGHSIGRVWCNASREPSDTLPGSQPCTHVHTGKRINIFKYYQVYCNYQLVIITAAGGSCNRITEYVLVLYRINGAQ